MASTYSLPFRVTVTLFLSFITLMNSAVLVNLGLDLKKGSRVHLVLLLGLSLHDALGALASLPWISLYNHPDRAVCDAVVYFIRLYLMASSTYVTVLSFERFLSLAAPFWYNIHVNVKTSVVAAVITSAFILLLDCVTFFESSVTEVKGVTTNATITECLAMTQGHIAVLMAAVNLINVTLTLVFNVTVIKKLHFLRRAVDVQDGNTSRRERSAEAALLRLVLALSVVSVVTNLPFSLISIIRLLFSELTASGRIVLTVVGSLGCVANPVVFLVCTARYRRRLRGWTRRLLHLPREQSDADIEAVAGTSSQAPAVTQSSDLVITTVSLH